MDMIKNTLPEIIKELYKYPQDTQKWLILFVYTQYTNLKKYVQDSLFRSDS